MLSAPDIYAAMLLFRCRSLCRAREARRASAYASLFADGAMRHERYARVRCARDVADAPCAQRRYAHGVLHAMRSAQE